MGICVTLCSSREPFKPKHGSLPFIVYFTSRYRGICVGTLVSRTAVLTAAVCITDPRSEEHDRRPITIIAGTSYRHPRRGIRVQVTKILIPHLNLFNLTGNRGYLMEKSPALLLLKRKVPDLIAEIPLRAMDLDWKGEEILTLHEECFMPGWHFFYKGDKIYPVHRFLLQRNLRVQFLNIVKTSEWCEALIIKFQKALAALGFMGMFEKSSTICVKDPGRAAQPCHGMYGAPLICKARVVGMLMAPDAQWTNCTGTSNIIHLLHSEYLYPFMSCISRLFEPEIKMDWLTMKKTIHDEKLDYDYLPNMYDQLRWSSGSTSTEEN
ncbi:unnamed protein product [Chilo suppressalis]|uniref:Peptidase S1 domain-containing protein n=1 Tax=Chilo suppressalis TaxID=168631 RepID=A0ABN8AZ99_CHISP|nr:unnamed protein product [Chilo suppressalis]